MPCLYNITDDPGEHVNLAADMPAQVTSMMARFKELDSEYHPPVLSPAPMDAQFCTQARRHRGFSTPYAVPVRAQPDWLD